METGIEVSDPGRALRVVVIGVGAGAILLVAIGALVAVPILNRADRALDALEEALPVVEEQMAPDVASLESHVAGVPGDLEVMRRELGSIGEGLSSVNDGVAALEPPLTSVDREMSRLRDDLAPVTLLRGVLDSVQVLPEMLLALQETRDGVAQVEGSIGETNARLQELLERFDRMLVLLAEIEQHVENIDRKTGPVVPPSPDDVGD